MAERCWHLCRHINRLLSNIVSRYCQIAATLIDIEAELRRIGHWDRQEPPTEALQSEQPFAVDTLSFNQWLQFIFIPRIRFLAEQEGGLPSACNITPMAEEFYRGLGLPVTDLLGALKNIDSLLSERARQLEALTPSLGG